MGMSVRFGIGRVNRQTAGHPQVQRQRPAVVEIEKNPLGATSPSAHLPTGEQRHELIGRRGFHHTGPVEPLDARNARTDDLHPQAIGGVLHFG